MTAVSLFSLFSFQVNVKGTCGNVSCSLEAVVVVVVVTHSNSFNICDVQIEEDDGKLPAAERVYSSKVFQNF